MGQSLFAKLVRQDDWLSQMQVNLFVRLRRRSELNGPQLNSMRSLIERPRGMAGDTAIRIPDTAMATAIRPMLTAMVIPVGARVGERASPMPGPALGPAFGLPLVATFSRRSGLSTGRAGCAAR
jgi:hypothetical protein